MQGAAKRAWQDPETRKHLLAGISKGWNEKRRKNQSTLVSKNHIQQPAARIPTTQQTREKISTSLKKYHENHPEYHAKVTGNLNTKYRGGCLWFGFKTHMYRRHYKPRTTEESKRKNREAHLGRHHSEETKRKISNKNKGRPKPPRTIKHIENLSESVRKSMKNPETRARMSAASKGRKPSEETLLKRSIALKGIPRTTEWKAKISMAQKGIPRPQQSGENNPAWKGGISFGKYCPKFNKRFKERVRARFGFTCVICGHIWKPGETKLSVHHVYYNKKSCCTQDENGNYIQTLPGGIKVKVIGDPNKFVPLCSNHSGRSCHTKTNKNRLEWALFFENVINTQFKGKSYFTEDEFNKFNAIFSPSQTPLSPFP